MATKAEKEKKGGFLRRKKSNAKDKKKNELVAASDEYNYSLDHLDIKETLEYVCGGELFSYLRSAGRFPFPTAQFYAAEITSALEFLHSLNIVYRDMKPENLLLDVEGHLKITDFGFAKELEKQRAYTLCGTPEYLAPEIILMKGHGLAVDWWALGILIYEMLVGCPPFWDDNPMKIYEKILTGKIDYPRFLNSESKSLVSKLLVIDRTKRLGSMKDGASDVKKSRFFKTIDWDDVYNRKLKPPYEPNVSHPGDSTNFEDYADDGWEHAAAVGDKEYEQFKDF